MSVARERYDKYHDDDLDVILVKIRSGAIKAGRYSHLVKVKKDSNVMKGKVLFDESTDYKKHSGE